MRRSPRDGALNPNAKLDPDQVLEIRSLRAHGWLLARIAEKFGVTPMCISKVCNAGSWAAVDGFAITSMPMMGNGSAKLKRLLEMEAAAKAKKLEADLK
jgi:hypothetical protein